MEWGGRQSKNDVKFGKWKKMNPDMKPCGEVKIRKSKISWKLDNMHPNVWGSVVRFITQGDLLNYVLMCFIVLGAYMSN